MQHSPGGGKTWINILYGLYLHQYIKQKVAYVTINEGLTEQLRMLLLNVPDHYITVILSS